MYSLTFKGSLQTTHATKQEAFKAARAGVESLRARLGIQWVCFDAVDDSTIVKKWNVLHGGDYGIFEVRAENAT